VQNAGEDLLSDGCLPLASRVQVAVALYILLAREDSATSEEA